MMVFEVVLVTIVALVALGLAAGAGPAVLGITDFTGGSDDDNDAVSGDDGGNENDAGGDDNDAVFDDDSGNDNDAGGNDNDAVFDDDSGNDNDAGGNDNDAVIGDDSGNDNDAGGDDNDAVFDDDGGNESDAGDDDNDAVLDDDGGNENDAGGDDLGDFDELDDDGLDEFDDDPDTLGGDEDTSELKNRIEAIENEVADLSSTVNTVQSENEAVSETAQDIEEKVRDLLEIYEMVTRGVNPFVDETVSGAVGGDIDGDFGLFDDDGNDDGNVDDSIADADAEEFFEDDFDDPGVNELVDPDDVAMLNDDSEMEDALDEHDAAMEDALDGADETGGDDGKSFGEIKEEYESGDPGWDVDDPIGGDESKEVGASSDPVPEDDSDDLASRDGVDDGTADAHGFEDDGETVEDDRLHLREFPDGYHADVTALEWLEYLIDVGGTDGARDALSYYVDIGWISPAVEDKLHAFLDGIRVSSADGERHEPGGLVQFDPEDHRRSLGYVAQLAGDSDHAAVPDGLDESPAAGAVASDDSSDPDPTGGQDVSGGDDDGI